MLVSVIFYYNDQTKYRVTNIGVKMNVGRTEVPNRDTDYGLLT